MSREYHKIYDGDRHKGFVSPTIDMPGVWSIYNEGRKKVAMVAPDGGQFNLMFYGKHAATTDYYTADTFPAAVQRAFKLGDPPQFEPELPADVLDPMGAALREMEGGGSEDEPAPAVEDVMAGAAQGARADEAPASGSNEPRPPVEESPTKQPRGVDGIDAYLEALLAEHDEARAKLYALDVVIAKARALRSKLM